MDAHLNYFRYAKEAFIIGPTGMIFPPGSQLLKLVGLNFYRMQEAGLLEHWKSKGVYREFIKSAYGGKASFLATDKTKEEPLSLSTFRKTFNIYGIGVGISFFFLIVEICKRPRWRSKGDF